MYVWECFVYNLVRLLFYSLVRSLLAMVGNKYLIKNRGHTVLGHLKLKYRNIVARWHTLWHTCNDELCPGTHRFHIGGRRPGCQSQSPFAMARSLDHHHSARPHRILVLFLVPPFNFASARIGEKLVPQ